MPSPNLTLPKLVEAFFAYLKAEVTAGRNKPATVAYYERLLAPWLKTMPAGILIADVHTYHLTATGGLTWHRVQAVQRLFTWARKQQFLPASPFADVQKPPPGRRERTLSRAEARLLLRACDRRPTRQRTTRRVSRTVERHVSAAAKAGAPVRPLRWMLMAMCRLGARPHEMRNIRWRDLHVDTWQIEMIAYKAKARRRDRMKARILLVDSVLARVLMTWQTRRNPKPDDFVFLNSDGKPWTSNAVGNGVRRARRLAGLDDGEPVVAYTQRHTAATRAANPLDGSPGATLPQIASWLGQASTRMTERYINLKTEDMRAVGQKAAAVRRSGKPKNGH